MKNLTVKAKLSILCAIMFLAFVVVNVFSFLTMNNMNAKTKEISDKWVNAIVDVEDLNNHIKEYRLYEYKHVSSNLPQAKQETEQIMNTQKAQVDQYVKTCKKEAETQTEKQLTIAIEDGWNAYLEVHEQVISQSNSNHGDSAQSVMVGNSYNQYKTIQDRCDSLVKDYKQQISNASANSTYVYDGARSALIVLDIVMALFSFLMEVYIIESITRPVKKMDETARRVAQGELDVSVDYQAKNELGSLAANLNNTTAQLKNYGNYIQEITQVLNEIADGNLDFHLTYEYRGRFAAVKEALDHLAVSLNDTLSQINLAADQVAGGADQVSSGSQALSQGTTEQASSVEELAATINEISEHVKGNADSANIASSKVHEVSGQLLESNRQMQEMIAAMGDIRQSSAKIGEIIKTIEDIAFQTNILALNAAVEAAHAGDAGKGFAVVAGEVRSLASKSAEASKSTADLIQASLKAVKHGSQIADETAKSLTEVVAGTKSITNGIGSIADASKEQSVAIEQVTQGVEQISNVIQTNTATSEESAAASQELSEQAQMLKNLVSQFKLRELAEDHTEAADTAAEVPSVVDQTPARSVETQTDDSAYEAGFEEETPSFAHDKY